MYPDPHALGVRSILHDAHNHAQRGLMHQRAGASGAAATSFAAAGRLIDRAADVASRAPTDVRLALAPAIAQARAAAGQGLGPVGAGVGGLGEQWAALPKAAQLLLIGVAIYLVGRLLKAW